MPKYLSFNKVSVAKPVPVVQRLLDSGENAEVCLACTEAFDPDAGEERKFEKAQNDLLSIFNTIIQLLETDFGKPKFAGSHKDKGYPAWAGCGYHVGYWKQGQRIIYLIMTHAGSDAPLSLDLGVIKGPPKNWYAGV